MAVDQNLVSVVILNWNDGAYIEQCIDHVLNQTSRPLEVILVDNGSTDGSIGRIEQKYRGITIIRNERNMGFCKGMNQGIEVSKGDYLLLLNADVFLDERFLEELLLAQGACGDPKVGMFGGKTYRMVAGEKTDEIDMRGCYLRKRMAVTYCENPEELGVVFGPPGNCPLLKHELLEDVRLPSGDFFDEIYFSQGEDLDLWFRAQLRGWKCLYVPKAFGWHLGSASYEGKLRFFQRSAFFQRHNLKNRHLTIIKDLPGVMLLYLLPWLILTELAIWPYFLFVSPRTLLYVVQSWHEVFQFLPVALERRKYIQSRRLVSPLYLKRYFIAI